MFKIDKIFSQENQKLFRKYVALSLIGYGGIFLGLFVLVDLLKINKSLSFFIIYGLTYLYLYIIQLKFLFKSKHDFTKLLRFYGSLIFFYVLANIIFNAGLEINLNYLVSSALTIIILMPFRFVVSKFFVFKH